jgi:hypothetical protein
MRFGEDTLGGTVFMVQPCIQVVSTGYRKFILTQGIMGLSQRDRGN